MGDSFAALVVVVSIFVDMAACGAVRDSFAFGETESSSWGGLLDYREILRPIASDSSASDIFLSVSRITYLSVFPNGLLFQPVQPLEKSRSSRHRRTQILALGLYCASLWLPHRPCMACTESDVPVSTRSVCLQIGREVD